LIRKIVEELQLSVGRDSAPRSIVELVEPLLTNLVGPVEAPERLEDCVRKVTKQLQMVLQVHAQEKRDCWFAFNSSSVDYLQGIYYIEPRDPPAVEHAKSKRMHVDSIIRGLQSVNFREFERICAAVLGLFGAYEVVHTPHSNDQGIDFYGRFAIRDLVKDGPPFFSLLDHMKVWLVGQAKHYVKGTVSAPEVRSLVGSIQLARFKEFATRASVYTDLTLRSCDPIFALFITTGTYSSDAKRLADNSGVVLLDLDGLSKFLADRRVAIVSNNSVSEKEQLLDWADNQLAIFRPNSQTPIGR
jgi:Restriction endonuclease